ncbi:GNAT family N-acetyltransferase [Celerinatantimonas diazotrophica]|uniref:RimJ/RimL family protein N-acetyltransferase n=1 Tax=Celerinatantimonas diazotrophica TaxID=412034 RepID=A0A4R1JL73_9GAMM|nr:GNAT family protein [Celerinatantimonas diazotrophica]TCK51795.1 RimJ/RimL family protein N-acetyltransferase [Celerinatantimonas diazotrophica]CAG9296513.1 hypothetical protein CEDIAZO_01664 [Celerinatantimonas diazotrophica]
MNSENTISIRKSKLDELEFLHALVTKDPLWTEFNGPYFPYQEPTLEQFAQNVFLRLYNGEDMQLICVNDNPIGSVSFYWECEQTRWLEMGVIIYDSQYWGRGIASQALPLWIEHLFQVLAIERVGLTTWSGNPGMMRCAQKVGLKQEARLRKVRYYKGHYYDSVKYGILRQEWRELKGQQSLVKPQCVFPR